MIAGISALLHAPFVILLIVLLVGAVLADMFFNNTPS